MAVAAQPWITMKPSPRGKHKWQSSLEICISCSAVGLAAAIGVMIAFHASAPVDGNSVFRWAHAFFGILWIGLLYYLNFVQVPTMPKIPAEQKGAITGHIAPKVFFFFRYGALLTLLTGLAVADRRRLWPLKR